MQVPGPRNDQTCRTDLQKCRYDATAVRHLSADDLLVLLAVGRSGRYVTAAEELGINHTTIARRIAALEQSIGGRLLARAGGGWELTDLGRDALTAAEAVEAAVRSLATDDRRRTHPGRRRAYLGHRRLQRLHRRTGGRGRAAAASRRSRSRSSPPPVAPRQQRSGLDIEVVVGEPQVHRAEADPARRLPPRPLRLGATTWPHTAPRRARPTCAGYPLVYFIDSMLQVDDLDLARSCRTRHARIRHVDQRLRPRRGDPGGRRPRPAAVLHGRPASTTWCGCSRTTSPCS